MISLKTTRLAPFLVLVNSKPSLLRAGFLFVSDFLKKIDGFICGLSSGPIGK